MKRCANNITLEKHCISLEFNNQLKKEIFQKNTLSSPESALTFAKFFKINELKAQAQAKYTVILQLKEKLRSLKVDVTERNVKREVEELETLNIELDHKLSKEQLNKLKGKAVLTEAVSLNPIDPELLKVDVAPLVPKLRKNRTAYTDYIRHTQDEAATLREILESNRLLSPLNTSLDYALPLRKPIPIVNSMDKPVVTLVYTRKPKDANKKVPNKLEPNNSWGSSSSNVPSSLLTYRLSKSSSGQFCDSDLEVAFRQHTCFIRNLDGVDLLTGSQGNNLYTLSLLDMMASSPIYNGTEFVNQTLRDYYEEVGISHETSVARSPQQNGVVKRRNCTLIEAARTIKLPDLSFFHVFGALCYPTNDSENLGLVRTSSSSTSYVPPSRNVWDLLFQPMFDELLNPPSSVVNQAIKVIAPIAEVIPQVDADSTGSPSSTTVDQDAPLPSKSLTPTEIQSSVILQDV
nr:integrase, catalytic region, zinc finger, CCHC-type, peptidase aspartic, catalytic [Tanacetum cinerariifolium]